MGGDRHLRHWRVVAQSDVPGLQVRSSVPAVSEALTSQYLSAALDVLTAVGQINDFTFFLRHTSVKQKPVGASSVRCRTKRLVAERQNQNEGYGENDVGDPVAVALSCWWFQSPLSSLNPRWVVALVGAWLVA